MRIVKLTNENKAQTLAELEPAEDDIAGVRQTVRGIIHQIIDTGDRALVQLTNQLDRNSLSLDELRVAPEEIEEAYQQTAPEIRQALELSAKRVDDYYQNQFPQSVDYTDEAGTKLGWRMTALDSVGLYVPGGTASYPSSVIMNTMPAKVAGVSRIAMVCPAMDGVLPKIVLAAAKICGISEIYKIGGAQAVAALAYGTETIEPVNKIVGPGNAYVAEAKRQVFGKVGIDMIAGPSEILVIADKNNNPDWLAADLLSQAEHDANARSIMITDSTEMAEQTVEAVEKALTKLEREEIARKSIENNGVIIVVENLAKAAEISNQIAPEHLELAVDEPEELAKSITNAGAIFLGRYTPEAIGDYVAGPSHVLPTSGSAKFSSGLSVFDFLKRQSIIGCSAESFAQLASATEDLANSEGLTAHALSISVRKGGE